MFNQINHTNTTVLDAIVDTNRRIVEVLVTNADKAQAALNETIDGRVTIDARITDALPTPAEAGARYLDFVERAVALNRQWSDRIVEMIRNDAPAATKAVATQVTEASKTVAEKATATQAAAKTMVAKTVAKPVARTTTAKPVARTTTAKKATPKKAAAKKAAPKKAAASTK